MNNFLPVEKIREIEQKSYDPCRSKYDEAYETVKKIIAYSIMTAAENNLNSCVVVVRNEFWKEHIMKQLRKLGYKCIPLKDFSLFQIIW